MSDLIADIQAILQGGAAIRDTAHHLHAPTQRAEAALRAAGHAAGHSDLARECAALVAELTRTHHHVLDALESFGMQVGHSAHVLQETDRQLGQSAGELR